MIELNKNDLLLVAGGVNYWGAAKSATIGLTAILAAGFTVTEISLGNMWLGLAAGCGSAILAGVGISYFSEDTAS